MSQRIIFETLQYFEDGATRSELAKRIDQEYPDRTLSRYLSLRLKSLNRKGAVYTEKKDGKSIYFPNREFSVDDLSISIDDFDRGVSKEELADANIEITNIVGGASFCDNIQLQELATDIGTIEYEPETTSLAVWKPLEDSRTVLIPSSGQLTIVGATTREEVLEVIDEIKQLLPDYCLGGAHVESFRSDFKIHNIVGSGDLNRELKLSAIATGLGLEQTEYDPEQFPGLVYWMDSGIVTNIFRTGSVILFSKTYEGLIEGMKSLREHLQDIGVEFN